jgi:glycosyltransferase involved in cell wall biosynthesis
MSDKTLDVALLEFAAQKLPNVSFVLIGSVTMDVNKLTELPNVYFLGRKRYEEIPFYGKEFDVAMMPWNRNKWIEFCNPVKTKEYLALGKPIVSIDYPELKPYYDVVYPACDYEQFVEGIVKALDERGAELKRKRREMVRDETWDSKVQRIIGFIENGRKKTSGTAQGQ